MASTSAAHGTSPAIVSRATYLPPRPGGSDRLFAMLHRPTAQPCRGLMVYVHPFADEMNKARRMAARQARLLAGQGWTVLMPDLSGCGDSEGHFGDAHWQGWLDDIEHAVAWLRGHAPDTAGAPLWLWGLRAGALLAAAAAQRPALHCEGLLAWQPMGSGKLALQQFLRLNTAARMIAGQGADKATVTAADRPPRQCLADGHAVDIAGYRLAPALALGLEAASWQAPAGLRRLLWLELSTAEAPELSPATRSALPRWQAAGCAVQAQAVAGPSFWQTTELEDAPALLAATLHLLATPDVALQTPAE